MKRKNKIYFLENSFDYNGNDLNRSIIGGSEKTLINITNELAKEDNFIIKVFNNTSNKSIINNVSWMNINEIDPLEQVNYVIAMSDANLFKYMSCKNNFLWSHSVQSFEKFIRKRQLIPFFKYKPIMILEGDYHYKTRSFLTSFYGKKILKIAPDNDFINTKVDLNKLPPANAIFTTKSDRNINFLLNTWHQIKKKSIHSKLFINPPHSLTEMNIQDEVILRKKGEKKLLIEDLINSRVFLTPGHKTEVFCLAAEEARELCIPIVTMGFGSLYERVEHGLTGFVAKNKKEFIEYTNLLLNDNNIYYKLKDNLIKRKNSRNYSHVKSDLIKLLNIDE